MWATLSVTPWTRIKIFSREFSKVVMLTFLIRRSLQTIAFMLVAWFLVYTVLVYLMPAGPGQIYRRVVASGGPPGGVNSEAVDLERYYALDKPWPISYLAWLFNPSDASPNTGETAQNLNRIDIHIGALHIGGSGMLTGDFGKSAVFRSTQLITHRPVGEQIGARWGNTVTLVLTSFVVALLFALPTGVIASVRRHSRLDTLFAVTTLAGSSLPVFLLGALLVVVFAVVPYQLHSQPGWGWVPFLPASSVADSGQYDNIINRIYHLALPVAALSLSQVAWLSKHVRFSMLEVLKQDYIRTARAKGVSPVRLILKHAFRNALIPLITTIGLALPTLVTGAILIETLFGYPGLGQMYFVALGGCLATPETAENLCPKEQALLPLDYPTVLALTFILIALVALSNMLADMLYTFADPRISYGGKSESK